MSLTKEIRSKFRLKTSMKSLRQRLIERDGPLCGICKKEIKNEKEISIDHIYPLCKGGLNVFENMQLSHLECNREKADKIINDGRGVKVKKEKYRGPKLPWKETSSGWEIDIEDDFPILIKEENNKFRLLFFNPIQNRNFSWLFSDIEKLKEKVQEIFDFNGIRKLGGNKYRRKT